MTENELLLQSFRDIQALKEGVHTYAYNTGEWIEIAVMITISIVTTKTLSR